MAKANIRIRSAKKRKSCTPGIGAEQDAESLVDQILFLASSGKLETKSKFSKQAKEDILGQLERQGASYDMLYRFSEQMNSAKNYEAIIWMLRNKNSFNDCDQGLILDAARAFVRDVGRRK